MKTDRKLKAGKDLPKLKPVIKTRRTASKPASSNGKHPLAPYEHIPIGIVESSPDGKYIDVNAEFCRIAGYTRNALLRKGIRDLTHEDDYALDTKLHEQLVAGEIPFYRLEKRFVRRDGSSIWVELTRSIVRDAKGKPLYSVGVVLDISERRGAEKTLRESAERLRLATEAARMFTWEWDFQKQNYTLADNFVQVLGFSADLLPKNTIETVERLGHPEDIQIVSAAITKAIESHNDLQSLECRAINPENGQVVWLELNAKIVYDHEGQPERMFGVAQNISENKEAQEQIRIISRVPEENPNPVMRLTPDGKVLYANNPSQNLLKIWRENTGQAIPGELLQHVADTLVSGSRKEIEIEQKGKTFSFMLAPIQEAGYVNLYGRDITERKRAEHAIQAYARQQEALYQLADQLHRTNSLPDVFNAAMDAILSALQCDRVSILLYDHTEVMQFVAWRGLSDDYRKTTEGHSPWKPDAKDQEPIVMGDIRTAKLDESLRAVIQREGIGSLAFIPLVSNGKLIGKFMVYFDTPHAFSDVECDISLIIAHQLAFGIDRIRTGEALARERELLERLFETMPVMVSIYDPETNSMRLNAEFERLIGWKTEEVTVVSLLESLYPDTEYRQYVLQRMAEAGRNEWVEVRVQTRDGRTLDTIWSNISILNDQKLAMGIALGIDISERKQMEEQLRVHEAELEEIINQTPFMLTRCTRDLHYRFVSRAYAEMIGRTPEEVAGKPIVEIMGEEGLRTISPYIEKVLQGEQVEYESEVDFQEVGAPFLHVVYTPDRDEHGNVIGWFASIVDISERKRAEEQLRRNEKMFSTLVDAAPFGVYFIDSEFRLRAINKGSESVFSGIQPLIGRDFEEIIHIIWQEPFASEVIERFRHTLRTGESFISPPVIEERANIEEIQSYDWQIHRIILSDGTFGVVCYFYDLSEQKRMEGALRASEELYRNLFDLVPVAVYSCDANGLIQEYNHRAVELWGREPLKNDPGEKFFGSSRIFYPDGRLMPHENCPMARTLRGESLEPPEFEILVERPNGVRRNVIAHPLLLKNERGEILGAINCLYDITERKQAEEALRESEQRFSAILRQATTGIVRKDAEGRFIFVNQAFCNMLGYTEADFQGKTIWEFMYQDDIEENKKSFDRLMVEGIPFKLERRFIRADGSVIWVDASVSPIMDAEGKPQSAVAVEVDITGRKQAEAALQQLNTQLEDRVLSRTAKLRAVNQTLRQQITERMKVEEALRQSEAVAVENEQKLLTLFDLLPVGISFLSPDGRILQMNSALPAILKLPKDKLLSQTYKTRKYIRADGKPMSPDEFASTRALGENRTIFNVETGVVVEGGGIIWTSVSAAPVDVKDVGVVVVTVDITESKRAERALQESRERLQILSQRLVEVQEEERRALARELHDRVGQTLAALNINLIIMNGQLSADSHAKVGERLNDSMKLVAETIALVRDVMTDLRPAVLDDYGLEAALEAHLNQYTSRYTIKAEFKKPSHPIPRLGASIEMTFLRIAQEALMNIAKHAQADQVSLALKEEEDAIRLTVQDNGIGIQSWQNANRPGSHGLTIMRERTEAFGGNLKVKSVPGKGTTIEITIPFRRDNKNEGEMEKHL